MKKKSIVRQAVEKLLSFAAYGDSKHADKLHNHGKPAPNKIYSGCTMSNYIDACVRFVKWCREKHSCKDLESARAYTGAYLRYRMSAGRSAWTIRKDAAAIAKLYQCKTTELGAILPKRYRRNVMQHRNGSWLGHFDANKHRDLVILCKSTGLRRREAAAVRPQDVYLNEQGQVIVHVTCGKGGKKRDITALNEEPLWIAAKAVAEGRDTLIGHIPKYAPIHEYRAEFARELYARVARPIENIPKDRQYICRGDRFGAIYDKDAMWVVSKALGHNRLDVVTSYLF